jgi:hypothetical protein
MIPQWQSTIALAIVAAATVYLVLRSWRAVARKGAGGCGTCTQCPGDAESATVKQRQIVSVDDLIHSANRRD